MASNTAVALSGGAGVSWQADIPGLASLGLSIGQSGLKRLAQAGVDVHTLACMSEIAEKCPASIEYRKEISECREAQRNESQWFYKVVELGAGTNFVADELLKKRAGENVVALLSTILPVMSGNSSERLLLKLFEAVGAELNNTPGFAQLRSFRESMTPLAYKTNFKDRVYHYHVISKHVLHADINGSDHPAYENIPNEETAVQVILALSKLVQDDSGLVLEYSGMPGSGWTIAYARHVLGLPVCIVSSPSNAVPVSGDYQNSRVFVHIYRKKSECKLLARGRIQHYFITRSLDRVERNGWQIDVGHVNLLESMVPQSDPMREACTTISRSLVHDFTEFLAYQFERNLERDHLDVSYLKKYSIYCLPQIRQRAQKILTLFGFDASESAEKEHGTWTDYLTTIDSSDDTVLPTDGWVRRGLGHTKISEPFDAVFDTTGSLYCGFLFRLVESASWLAFTNWAQNVRLLSARFIDSPEPNPYLTKSHFDVRSMMMQKNGIKGVTHEHMLWKNTEGNEGRSLDAGWNTNKLCQVVLHMVLTKDERRQEVIFPLSIVSIVFLFDGMNQI